MISLKLGSQGQYITLCVELLDLKRSAFDEKHLRRRRRLLLPPSQHTERVERVRVAAAVVSSNWLSEKQNTGEEKNDMTMGFLLSFASPRYSSFLVLLDVFAALLSILFLHVS